MLQRRAPDPGDVVKPMTDLAAGLTAEQRNALTCMTTDGPCSLCPPSPRLSPARREARENLEAKAMIVWEDEDGWAVTSLGRAVVAELQRKP